MTDFSKTRPPDAALLAALKAVVGPAGYAEEASELAPHLTDWRGLYRGRTPLLLKPASADEVAEIVRLCAAARVAIVPQGGNTGLVGGSVPDATGKQVLLCLSRLNRIRALDPEDFTLTAEAGCILATVQEAAAQADRLFPLSLGAEGRCQVGGIISTNAGGTAVLRYGSMRDLVLGIEAVLPDGRIWNGLRRLRKDNTGYDLKQLFIGAEGTLGIVTAAVLKLFPRPHETITGIAAVKDPSRAVALLTMLRDATGEAVSSFELLSRNAITLATATIPGAADPLPGAPWCVLIELGVGSVELRLREAVESALARAIEEEVALDVVLATSDAQAKRLWHLREAIVEAQRLVGPSIKHDVSAPVSAVPDMLARADAAVEAVLPGVRPMPFGHLGDGNIHYNLLAPPEMSGEAFLALSGSLTRAVHDTVAALGGSISAEHGLGQLRREEILRYKSPLEMELMRRVKAAIDPVGIM
ncbi:MAG TPA: FAD-binding oxidoreductase, partial [Alphaproteobacteria bacterium]|nr:FAD-binding oxidoreductase [Alphaproteobacteria bacterium]